MGQVRLVGGGWQVSVVEYPTPIEGRALRELEERP